MLNMFEFFLYKNVGLRGIARTQQHLKDGAFWENN